MSEALITEPFLKESYDFYREQLCKDLTIVNLERAVIAVDFNFYMKYARNDQETFKVFLALVGEKSKSFLDQCPKANEECRERLNEVKKAIDYIERAHKENEENPESALNQFHLGPKEYKSSSSESDSSGTEETEQSNASFDEHSLGPYEV